jgi:hypothetical protein
MNEESGGGYRDEMTGEERTFYLSVLELGMLKSKESKLMDFLLAGAPETDIRQWISGDSVGPMIPVQLLT